MIRPTSDERPRRRLLIGHDGIAYALVAVVALTGSALPADAKPLINSHRSTR